MELGEGERDAAGRRIAAWLLGLPEFGPAGPGGVFVYESRGSEVPTIGVIAALRAARRAVGVPQVLDTETGLMRAVRREAGGVVIPMDEPAVVVVPGLGFCPQTGARLGQGGGFYDRYLAARPRTFRIGLAFVAQLDPRVAATALPHDEPMDALCCESGTLRFPRRWRSV